MKIKINLKTFLYRAYLTFLALIAAYAIYGIAHFKWVFHNIDQPVSFQVTGDLNSDITVIEFLNYSCQFCKELHPTVKELMEVRKDIRYIARPIPFEDDPSMRLTKIAMAAGLQGKFWEMHNALLENPNVFIDDAFIEETSNLFGIDYAQLTEDIESDKVKDLMNENIAALINSGTQYTPSFLVGKKIYLMGEEIPTLIDLIEMVNEATES